MKQKHRKDNKGRVLRTGEMQRGSDGLYAFSYTDRYGKRRRVYADTLEKLRKKEKEIAVGATPSTMTVDQMFNSWLNSNLNILETTRWAYYYQYSHFIRPVFGDVPVAKVVYSDVIEFYTKLHHRKGLAKSTLAVVDALLLPVFNIAQRDGTITLNPVRGAYQAVLGNKRLNRSRPSKDDVLRTLDIESQRAFIRFLSTDASARKLLYPLCLLAISTGMRVGELLGLTWADMDFDEGYIDVNHALAYRKKYGKDEEGNHHRFFMVGTKTFSGNRRIPMTDEVSLLFKGLRESDGWRRESSLSLDGYSDFVFLNREKNLLSSVYANQSLHRSIVRFNKRDEKGINFPDMTMHDFRHLFCSRLCEMDMNVKVIQTLMGHTDIRTTLDVYTRINDSKKRVEMLKLEPFI